MSSSASDIIRRAYREANVLGINSAPTTAQQSEGLDRLNTMLAGVLGFEAGIDIADLNIGGTFDQSWSTSWFVPPNARLVMEQTGARTLKLHPQPYDGQRLAVADGLNNLATYPLTLDGNGRMIEGAAQITISDSNPRQWLYRGDMAQWLKMIPLALDDIMPFPIEFDDFFAITLGMRLNPAYGLALGQDSAAWLARCRNAFQARYRRPRPQNVLPTRELLGGRRQGYGPPNSAFNIGWGGPW